MSMSPLPTISAAATVPADADVVIIGIAEASEAPVIVGHEADVLDAVLSLGGSAKPGSLVALPGYPVLLVAGLGAADVTPERVRRTVGGAVRAAAKLAGQRTLSVAVSLELIEPEVVQGAAEGALLGGYAYAKTSDQETTVPVSKVTIVSAARGASVAVREGVTIATAVCRARDWVNLPANVLYPETFADEARALAKGSRLKVEVLDEAALTKGGYGGLLAVGGGSVRPPRLVKLAYSPRGAQTHIALVGKGITFDTGGVNIKPADGMLTMKCDMAGAAAVLAAVAAIAELKLPIRVTAWAAMAENMPSGSAYRPSDVLTLYGGTTVENANSDAEGRLVLADALVRAGEEDPDLLVDVATLTGACVVALGERMAGLMASDDETADRLLDAAEASGEPLWHLPIPEEARENLSSEVADLSSTGKTRWGGALTAAAFLREFAGEGRHWAHLDIAGPAFNSGAPYDYTPKGGTGSAVRTLVALARQLSVRS